MFSSFNFNELHLITFFFVLVRVTGVVFFLPFFGDKVIPTSVKILFSFSFSWIIFGLLKLKNFTVSPQLLYSNVLVIEAVMVDVFFGIGLGYIAKLVFDAIQTAGYFAGTAVGFSIASIFDPNTESQNLALGEFHYILCALLFLSLDGHHALIQLLLKSFDLVPLGKTVFASDSVQLLNFIIQLTADVFSLAIRLAAPVLVVVFIINITFGFLARAVPQMNVMAVSFTANIIVGLTTIIISLPGFMNMVSGSFENYSADLIKYMRLFGG